MKHCGYEKSGLSVWVDSLTNSVESLELLLMSRWRQ